MQTFIINLSLSLRVGLLEERPQIGLDARISRLDDVRERRLGHVEAEEELALLVHFVLGWSELYCIRVRYVCAHHRPSVRCSTCVIYNINTLLIISPSKLFKICQNTNKLIVHQVSRMHTRSYASISLLLMHSLVCYTYNLKPIRIILIQITVIIVITIRIKLFFVSSVRFSQ